MFYTTQLSKHGIYLIKFYQKGEPVNVIVDDLIINFEEFPLLLKANLWVHIVEKAWAKLHGNYFDSFKLDKSIPELYTDLTGCKVFS